MKCLVVDDSAVVRRIMIRSLQALGFTDVVEAQNGSDALAKCDDSIELIMTDWNMPVMGGLELVKSLRANEATAKKLILMVTTDGAREDVAEAVAAGVDGCMFKPFTTDTLREKIHQITGAAR